MVPRNRSPDVADSSRSSASDSRPSSRYMMTEKGYVHPMKTYIWITLLIIGIMSLLY